MEFIPTHLPEVQIVRPKVFADTRGFFAETFQAHRFAAAGLPTDFVQDNHSGSHRGALRGLHYQIQQAQGKLIRAVAGEIFDVAVDLRRASPTFKQWVGVTLSAENRDQLWIPAGFAHGYLVLSDWAEIFYKTTDFYAPTWERCLAWNDPEIGVEWPLSGDLRPLLSAKDQLGQTFPSVECYA